MSKYNIKIDGISFWGPHKLNKGGLRIHWSADEGFGVTDLVQCNDDTLFIEKECMSDDFVVAVFKALLKASNNGKVLKDFDPLKSMEEESHD